MLALNYPDVDNLVMRNTALAHAILDSGKKKKTIARLARLAPYELSRILTGEKIADAKQRERLAVVLQKSETDLFPDTTTAASSNDTVSL